MADITSREERIRTALAKSREQHTALPQPSEPAPTAPLTRFQEGLWFNAMIAHSAGQPSDPRPVAFRLRGPLELPKLEAAIHKVQERHALLRTRFPNHEGIPIQVVEPVSTKPIGVQDLRSLPETEREDEARARARKLAITPFDLEREPPFRPFLFHLADEDHLLVLAMHHIVFDGWSAPILERELQFWYAKALGLTDHEPTPIPIHFTDYAAWTRAQDDAATEEQHLDYWREQLSDLEGELDLPVERPAPSAEEPLPAEFTLPADLTERFQELGRSLNATPFMVLLASAQVLAARLSRQSDFAVGVATAGRTRPEIEPLIGCFINMLFLRTHLSEATSFSDAIAAARDQVVGGLAHQAVPFSRVAADHRRANNRPPHRLFVQMRNFPPLPPAPTTPLHWSTFDLRMPAFTDLTIEGRETASGLHILINYDPATVGAATARRWAGHLRNLISAGVEAPDTIVWDLDMIDPSERHTVLRDFNEPIEIEEPSLVSDLIAERAERYPDDVAYVDGDEAVSYRRLLEMADGIAERLRTMGASSKSRVVLVMEPGLQSAIAIVGLLRSGAAYVPVDPSVSAVWLTSIIADTDPLAILTHRRLASAIGDVGAPTLSFEDVAIPIPHSSPTRIHPDNLAYICYTSGSTGPPKGVMVTHANLAAAVQNQEFARYRRGSRVLQVYSISFDGAVTKLLCPLVQGSTAVLRDRDAMSSTERFLAWCEDQSITHMGIPASLFHTIMADMTQIGLSFPTSVEHVSTSGEQIRADAVSQWYSRTGVLPRLHNLYGPTETTVWVLRKDLSDRPGVPYERIPIGTPVPNAWAYILDDRGQPTPIGVAGDLHIGGTQVGRGYAGKAKLTAERFVPDGFSDIPGSRLYRTGDLARWLPNGDVEFMGRLDRQIKIRGYRVEPEAVETVLRRHPRVIDAAVSPASSADGTTSLRAYVVLDGEDAPDLEEWLRGNLPDYMVPNSVTVLDELPRTPSRKLDESQLPEPAEAPASTHTRDAIEHAVADIWCEVLDRDDIPDGGDFFALGGHSLLAMQVLGRVKRTFGIDLPLSTLFEYPAIESFAAAVTNEADPDWEATRMRLLLAELEQLDPDEAAEVLAMLESESDIGG